VLFGWLFDIPALTTMLPHLASMKVNTAIAFLLSSASLCLRPDATGREGIGRALAVAVAAIGLLSLIEYSAQIDLHIDQLLWPDRATPQTNFPGRMSAITAFNFLLFGTARTLAGARRTRINEFAFVVLSLLGLAFSYLALLGYLYNAPVLYHPVATVSIALHTAFAFLLLYVGLMALRPDLVLVALLRAPGAGGTLFRMVLPVIMLLPPSVGWLRLQGELSGLYDMPVGLAIFTSANVLILTVVLSLAAHRAERLDSARRESEQHYSTIVNLMQDGIAIFGAGIVRYANPYMARMLGAEGPSQLERRPAISFVAAEDRPRFDELWRNVNESREPVPITELRLLRSDDRQITVELQLTPFTKGGERQVLALCKDVTAEREQAAQLRQSQKMEALGNLTGGMAHDFNNLLGVVIGNLDLLIEGSGDQRTLAVESLDAALRGADLTRRLLAFARRQPLAPQRLELNELIAGMTRLLSRVLGEDIAVSLDLAPGVWPVVADPAQLESALVNLAANARDALPRGGRLLIATGNRPLDADYAAHHAEVVPGDYAMVEVSDNGSGMSPEVLNRIFEPFFTTKEVGKGTGLGLAMVFGFMKQSGGHISVYSEPGVGTTFRLYLPRSGGRSLTVEETVIESAKGGSETVLVVEDNEAVRRVLVRQLSGLGYKVLQVENAGAALELLAQEAVDLLLTDVVMAGGMDGLDLARHARERWPALKVVLSSGFPQGKLDGNVALPNDVKLLSKPYRKEELARLLREVLGA
jgi:PAS domain S-box-containing protein